MLLVLAMVFNLVAFVCGIIILIHAFQNEVWKGILCLFTCGLYMLYYSIVEFENDNKWPIVGGWLGGGIIATVLRMMSMGGNIVPR